jgi:hypothetical protein
VRDLGKLLQGTKTMFLQSDALVPARSAQPAALVRELSERLLAAAAEAGNDHLAGGIGSDTLTGGLGADILNGGAGSDRFDFNAIAESGKTATTRDSIADFTHLADDLDLSTIDARAGVAGNQAFTFIGDDAFTASGQIRGVGVGADPPDQHRGHQRCGDDDRTVELRRQHAQRRGFHPVTLRSEGRGIHHPGKDTDGGAHRRNARRRINLRFRMAMPARGAVVFAVLDDGLALTQADFFFV